MSDLKRQMQIYTNGLWKDVHHTTAAEWPPELVRFAEPMRPEMPDPKNTFADHSYPAYSRAQMVQAMLDAVELYRRTQPEATKPAQELSAAILAIPLPEIGGNFQQGFRTALLKAAALASPADALSAGDRVDAVLFERLFNEYMTVLSSAYCQCDLDEELAEQCMTAIQAQKDGHANRNADTA